LLNKPTLVFRRHAVVYNLESPHRKLTFPIYEFNYPTTFFSSRSYYSVSPQ